MAPSRRKGGSRASAAAAAARRQWKVGDLVLAKVKGFPAWPATVSEPEKWGYSSDGKKVLVYFFGTQQIAFSNPIDVEPFTEERKESLLTKRHGKGADFIRAVHEIIDSYEQLKKGEAACNSVDKVTWKNSGISEDNLGSQNETPDMELSSCEKTPLSVEGKWSNIAVEDSVGIIRESDNLHDLETSRAPKAKNQGNTYFSRKRFRGVQLNSCPSLKKVTAPRSSRSGKGILSPGNDAKASTDIPASALRDGTRNNRVWESSNVNGEERDPHAMPLNGSSKENGSENLTVGSGCKLQQIDDHGLEHCHEIELNHMPVLVAEAVIVRKKRNQSRKRAIIDASDAVARVAEDRGSEVEVLGVGQDFPDVRLTSSDKGDGDEHLPLVKRARVRLGRSSSKKEDQDNSTLLEEKSSINLNKAPGYVCTSLTQVVDCNVDTKLHVARYDVSDSVKPKECSQYTIDQLEALDGRSSAKLGCLVDGEATLPPSKRLHRALEAMSANAAEGTKSDASLPTKTCIYGSYSNKGSPDISEAGEKKCPAMENIDLSSSNASRGISTGVSTSSKLPLLEENAYCSGEQVNCCKLVSKNDNQNNEFCEDRYVEILESVEMKSVSLPSLSESIDKLLGCNGGSLEPNHRGQDENMDDHQKIEKPLENLEGVNLKSLSLPFLGESMDRLLDNHHKVEKPLESVESVDENMDNHHKIEKSPENRESVDMKCLSLPSLGESMDKLLGCNEASLESMSPSKCIGQDETMDNYHKIEKPLRKPDISHDCEMASDPGSRDGGMAEELPGEGNFSATTRPSNSPATEIKEDNKVFLATGDIRQTLKDSHVITSPTTLKDIEAAECLQNLSVSASISLDHTVDRDISGQGSSSSMTNRLGSMACESPPSTSICNDYAVENDRIVDNTGCYLLASRMPLLKPKDTDKWSSKTEATAALASFEAALVTLTRTKENITGATRIAIDCAKYGNASKVVEIIAHNLETEPNLHRRVDLFFLVDSIAQCSRGLKGEVGDIYPSAIQESLKRLLLAAAPPGSSTLENCRQCLKVLRLWLERRILPDSIIRHHIRELEALCCSSSGSVFAKRTMRTDRPFDDPIREMDGMLVDEYGSNSNFKLAGFCMPPMLKDEDEDDESDSDGGDFEAVTPEHECRSYEAREIILPATTVVKHTCVLEDVDGELEMEDVSPNCDAEMTFISNSVLGPSNVGHQFDNNILLPFLPPLPVDLPPSSPPLPTSPPPPPPPPPPASSIPVPFDSKVYVGAHNISAVNPESLPFHVHEHREIQMQPSIQGVCTTGVFNGHSIPNLHVQQHVNVIQENNGNILHNATYPMHSLQPAPSNQFSYIHSDQWLQSQREVPCPYPGPVGGNFCNDFDRRNMGPHETGGSNWRFPGPPITGGSYAQHYPGPVCDPPNEPNHGWGFPQWNGNHQDFMPHRPPAEGHMPVPIRAPCFWQPR